MKSSDRTILIAVACLGLVAAFWFLVLSPKREEASELSSQVSALQAEVSQQEADAATAGAAKSDFKSNYRKLITLGKAVPVDADTPSLLTQLQTLSQRSDVKFQSIALGGSGGAPVSPATAVTGAPITPGAATEATASLLPIGATVGAAGLPLMPYSLEFEGDFFDVAKFFGEIDAMVDLDGPDTVVVNGRLLTINSFTMAPVDTEGGSGGDVQLGVSVDATSYLSPADQGVTGGATEGGPLATPLPATTPSTTEPVTPAVVGQ